MSKSRPAMIFGCGYLGMRVAKLWLAQGRVVAALTRSRTHLLREQGVEPIPGDVTDAGSLRDLPTASTVLYCIGMDRSAGHSLHDVYITGLRNVMNALPPCMRFIYISSTSVYGQHDEEWVAEDSPTEPLEESGRVILEAEQIVRAARPEAILLRFAGIYGPGRRLREQALLKGEPLVGDAEKWLNLIHVEDGARAVLAAEERGRPGETYLVSDGTPVRRRDFYTRLAQVIGAPEARFEPSAVSPRTPEPNRRIRNDRLRADLAFTPRYPSCREGIE